MRHAEKLQEVLGIKVSGERARGTSLLMPRACSCGELGSTPRPVRLPAALPEILEGESPLQGLGISILVLLKEGFGQRGFI